MEGLFAVFFIVVAAMFFAYYTKTPIAFLFSSVIAMATSSYLFRLHASGGGGGGGEGPTYFMFGAIFVVVALWQIVEGVRRYV